MSQELSWWVGAYGTFLVTFWNMMFATFQEQLRQSTFAATKKYWYLKSKAGNKYNSYRLKLLIVFGVGLRACCHTGILSAAISARAREDVFADLAARGCRIQTPETLLLNDKKKTGKIR